MSERVDREKIEKAFALVMESASTETAMRVGRVNEESVARAERNASAALADFRAELNAMMNDLDAAHEREESMVKRAMMWESFSVPAKYQEVITFSFDKVLLGYARDWRTVAIDAVRSMMEEANRRIKERTP